MTEQSNVVPFKLGGIVETVNGQIIDLHAPSYNNLYVEDLFGGLARCNRFNGRSHKKASPVTVLQHSFAMYLYAKEVRHLPESVCIQALMHDAHEALVGDIINPITVVCKDFKDFLDSVQSKVFRRFTVRQGLSGEVKTIDHLALAVEWAEFVATDNQVRAANGEHYGYSMSLANSEPYKNYLKHLMFVRGMDDADLVFKASHVLYRYIANQVLDQGDKDGLEM